MMKNLKYLLGILAVPAIAIPVTTLTSCANHNIEKPNNNVDQQPGDSNPNTETPQETIIYVRVSLKTGENGTYILRELTPEYIIVQNIDMLVQIIPMNNINMITADSTVEQEWRQTWHNRRLNDLQTQLDIPVDKQNEAKQIYYQDVNLQVLQRFVPILTKFTSLNQDVKLDDVTTMSITSIVPTRNYYNRYYVVMNYKLTAYDITTENSKSYSWD